MKVFLIIEIFYDGEEYLVNIFYILFVGVVGEWSLVWLVVNDLSNDEMLFSVEVVWVVWNIWGYVYFWLEVWEGEWEVIVYLVDFVFGVFFSDSVKFKMVDLVIEGWNFFWVWDWLF